MSTVLVDFHNHCLPHMDDGAENAQVSSQMILISRQQGVDRIVATPHYHAHKESVSSFLARRKSAFDRLRDEAGGDFLPDIIPGAEIRLVRELSREDGLDRLCFGASKHLMLELPVSPLKDWMLQEIENIAYQYSVTPVLAHVDRYVFFYPRDDLERVLSLESCVFQINNEALFHRKTLRFALSVMKRGLPFVFGSDAHNLSDRAPNHDRALRVSRKRKISLENTHIIL